MIFGSNTNHARTILFSRFTSSRLNPYAKELVYSKKGRNQTQIFVNKPKKITTGVLFHMQREKGHALRLETRKGFVQGAFPTASRYHNALWHCTRKTLARGNMPRTAQGTSRIAGRVDACCIAAECLECLRLLQRRWAPRRRQAYYGQLSRTPRPAVTARELHWSTLCLHAEIICVNTLTK